MESWLECFSKPARAFIMALPALRGLEAYPVEVAGEHRVCLCDGEGYVEESIELTLPAFFIATLLDGQNDLLDIQYRFAAKYKGVIPSAEQIQSLVNALDAQGFLCTETFRVLQDRVHRSFSETSTRPAYMAGKSYPDNPEVLRAQLDEYLALIPPRLERTVSGPPSLLIAPHIDFARGHVGYAHAYGELRGMEAPETVFVFGVAHAGGEAPFIPLNKGFETPLGTLAVASEVFDTVNALCPALGPAVEEADCFLHRNEHSIEFQAVWLAYLFGTNVRIVPILCGQLFMIDEGTQAIVPRPGVEVFLAACRDVVASRAGKVLVIAGADWAHVGRRFGDAFDISQTVLEEVERRDRADLIPVLAGNAEAFLQSVMQDQNARRVCGLGCIYAAMQSAVPKDPGELLYYGRAPDPQGGIVSFASICFGDAHPKAK